jgi:two-component system cell cycle sensor histidine kinase/response regulator CckA
MLGNATLAKQTVPVTSPIGEHLQQIEQAARRAADLCQQMLAYAGRKEIRAQRIDLSEIVRSTAALLRVSIHKNTRLTLQLDDALPAVLADRAQLQQILMNLVINAADAIGEAAGEITIVTFQRFATAELLRTALHQPELAAGNYVGFEVRDTGSGMSPETMARIFEPFFTTKFSGRGLGLASVLGIVQRHRGALFVESELGRGSTFRMWLKAESDRAPQSEAPAISPVQRLSGTALVVDDEDPVRDIIGRVLRRHGMKPVLASSGEEALQLYADHNDHFDLVLLDLTMPGLSGEQTLRALRERNAGQRVMVMSGYSEQDTMSRCAQLGVTDFIAKPFEVDVLLSKLNGGPV